MVSRERVRGVGLDDETRCAHYGSSRDVIAIRFPCCGDYFACYECHAARTNHDAERWSEDARGERAVLCGRCDTELTITEYLACEDACPDCGATFNPGCANHYHLYFAGVSEASGADPP
ncbi:CHY zinc finger protein [Halalkalicoccus jeotgali]|uniref:CHY-type domain-containing protein n=1 Tax=Halalkalicoccus jeotgali (strain DSM 18796 / CECT 7217 / JCM 14584 / KCTC 4019 / B3) TaxID=795797 RepID=D8J8Y6_HALJB|nr:CHY zinc finger protein [Halalkalicoccus jeotgali]ADJ14321.1 hypothetical protein HacjB3_04650 [Halalkalicoccus jeotgali B3]ELY40584.1 hypothetical protein C497_03017 [Halalkalicoccus jeotgali B3]